MDELKDTKSQCSIVKSRQIEVAYHRVCLLDMPGSAMGRYGRVQRRCSRKMSQKSLEKRRKRDEVVIECTETPLKAGMSGEMSRDCRDEQKHEQIRMNER